MKLFSNLNKKNVTLLLLILVMSISLSLVVVAGEITPPPDIPEMDLKGTVMIDGDEAPAGLSIKGFVQGDSDPEDADGEDSTTSEGQYTLFIDELEDIDGTNAVGNDITFTVDDYTATAEPTVTYSPGTILFESNILVTLPHQTDHIVISEVAVGIGSAGNEFIELYNPTDNDIDLSNFNLKLIDSDDVISTKTITWTNNVIPSEGFFLFAAGDVGLTADATFSTQMTDTSGVIITDENDVVIDKVAWGATPPSNGVETTGVTQTLSTDESIERKTGEIPSEEVYGNGQDTDDNSYDFFVQDTPNPQNSDSCRELPGTIVVETENCEHTTIQSAIDDANSGDEIEVTGTYTEDLTINKPLYVEGFGATLNGVHTITAEEVTIDSFTLNPDGGIGITIDSSASALGDIEILNNIFDLTTGNPIGILLGGYTTPQKVSDIVIDNNIFNGPDDKNCNPWKIGGWFGNPVGVSVNDVYFEDNDVNKCSIPINLHDQNIEDILIDGNIFRDTDGVVYVWEDAGENPTGILSGFVFTDNDVDSSNSYGIGIDTASPPVFTDANFGTGIDISNNNFRGIPGAYGFDAVSILSDLTTYKLIAENNWWGDTSGPTHSDNLGGSGDSVSDNVDFDPWLTRPIEFASITTTDPDTIYKNGDTINIILYSDHSGYTVTADFTSIEGEAASGTVVDNEDATYSISYTLVDGVDGTQSIPITANSLTDDSYSIEIDTIGPAAPSVTLVEPINAANQDSVAISGTGEADTTLIYTISDGVNPDITGTGTVDSEGDINITGINVSSLNDGNLTLSVILADVAGNEGTAGTATATKDTDAPTILSATTGHIPIFGYSTETMKLVVKFSEDVTSVDISDFAVEVEGVDYELNSISIDDIDGDGDIDENFVTITLRNELPTGSTPSVIYDQDASGGITDTSGNLVLSQTEVANDGLKPNVLIESELTSPTKSSPIPIKITFTEEVSGFIESEIVVGNGDVSNFVTSDYIEFTADITPLLNDVVTIDVAADVAEDLSENDYGNVAADQFTITYDSTPPEFSTITSPGDEYFRAGETITIIADLGETGLTVSADVNVLDSTLSALILSDDDNNGDYTVTTGALDEATMNEGEIDIPITAVDEAGNSESGTLSVILDKTSPEVTITSEESDPTNANPILININFTEEIDIFDVNNISIDNGVVNNLITSDNANYTAEVTPTTDGNVTVNISVDKFNDLAGNSNTVLTQFIIEYDSTEVNISEYSLEVDGEDQGITASFSPNGDSIRDTVEIDIRLSEAAETKIHIKNSLGETVKNLYESSSVTNPDAKTWDGTNESDEVVADGTYTIEINLTDAAGNYISNTTKSIILDTVDPTITDLTNTGDILFNADSTWTATANDESSGVASYQFSHNSSGVWVDYTDTGVEDSPTFLSISNTSTAEVAHLNVCARFTITDVAGNSNSSENSCFTVANSPPTLETIPTLTLNEDLENSTNLTNYVSDSDGDTITYTTTPADPDKLEITVEDNIMTVTSSEEHWNGEAVFDLVIKDDYEGITVQKINVEISALNDVPVIAELPSQNFTEDQTSITKLDLSLNTTDVETTDSTLLTYEIVETNESLVLCTISDGYFVDFTLAENYNGDTTCTVKAGDGEGNSSIATINIKVNPVNDAPKILSNPVTSANEDNGYVYILEVEDIDNDELTYSLTENPEGMGVNTDGIIIWSPGNDDVGDHDVVVVVSDGSAEDTQSFTVAVSNENDVPTVPELYSPEQGTEFSGTLTDSVTLVWNESTDIDNDPITYYVFNSVNETPLLSGSTTDLEFVISNLENKTYYWSVLASDGDSNSSMSDIWSYDIVENLLPSIDSHIPIELSLDLKEGDSQEFSIVSSDPDGEELDVEWFVDGDSVSDASQYEYVAGSDSQGEREIMVVVTDSFEQTDSVTWIVDVENVNQNPVITLQSQTYDVDEDEDVVINLSVSDPDNDTIELNTSIEDIQIIIVNSADDNTSYQLLWTPTNDDVKENTIEITADDGNDGIATATVVVTVENVNDAPEIVTVEPEDNPVIAAGDGQTFRVVAEDVDSENLENTIESNFSGTITYQEANKDFSFILSDADVGVYNVTVVMSDGELEDKHTWTLTVTNLPQTSKYESDIFDLPEEELAAVSDVEIVEPTHGSIDFGDQEIDFRGVVDFDNIFNISKGVVSVNGDDYDQLDVPATLTMKGLDFQKSPFINKNNGMKAEGDDRCTSCENINYENGELTFDVDGFSTYFAVENTTNDPPVITSTAPGSAIVDQTFVYSVKVKDFDDDEFDFDLNGEPDGMTISDSGVIRWTPSELGEYTGIKIMVSDGEDVDSQTFDLIVSEGEKLRITEVDVKVGGRKDSNLFNNTLIGKEAEPGDSLEFKVNVENGFSDRVDLEIEDIEVTMTIEGIDDEEDLDEDAKEFDLRQGKDKTVTFDFKVPLITDEETYDVIIEAEGKDENGTKHKTEWVLFLDVEKDTHKVGIENLDLSPSKLTCNKNSQLSVRLRNLGQEDEDEVVLSINGGELGFNKFVENIEIDENEKHTETVNFRIEEDLPLGLYPIDVMTTLRGDEITETIDLEIGECIQRQKKTDDTNVLGGSGTGVVDVIIPPTIAPPPPPTIVVKKTFRDSDQYMIVLGLSVGILVLMIFVVLSILIIRR